MWMIFQLIHALRSIVVPEKCANRKVRQLHVSAFLIVQNKAIHDEWFAQTEMKPGIPTVKCIVNVVCVILMIHDANQPN